MKIAVLDDYGDMARDAADWSRLPPGSSLTVFDRPLALDEARTLLASFNVLCLFRERMAVSRTLLESLPNLRLIVTMGQTDNLDAAAAEGLGITVRSAQVSLPLASSLPSHPTPELAWALLMATVRSVARQDRDIRSGVWRTRSGPALEGRTLGLLGLGNVGKRMARYAQAFDMKVIAWSQNLTADDAAAVGAQRVEREQLFREADILSIHLALGERSRRTVGQPELALMKSEAYLINTSRGAIVDEAALISALQAGRIAGAGLDVFEVEPLPQDHPFRTMENVTLTPHAGYAVPEVLALLLSGLPDAIAGFAAGKS